MLDGTGPLSRAGGPGEARADGYSGNGSAGYSDNKDAVLKRLHRIEGQVRGISRMVEADTYCIDVLTQVSAATRALQAVAVELLGEHLAHCVHDAIAAGEPDADDKIAEARAAIERLVRS